MKPLGGSRSRRVSSQPRLLVPLKTLDACSSLHNDDSERTAATAFIAKFDWSHDKIADELTMINAVASPSAPPPRGRMSHIAHTRPRIVARSIYLPWTRSINGGKVRRKPTANSVKAARFTLANATVLFLQSPN